MQEPDAKAIPPSGDGKVAMEFGKHIIRIQAEDTAGSCGMLEAVVPAGEGPPLHVHEREDEFFRVLSGRFGFWCADEYVELSEGGCIVLPPGILHCFQNVGTTEGGLAVIVTPGGFEGFFPAVESANPQTPEEIATIVAQFGLRFLPEQVAEAA